MAAVQLEHLTGVRFFLALWIVCGHYMPSSPDDRGFAITCRSFVAVNFFVVMSGFVTHLAYGHRLASGALNLKRFYFRRMAQVVITTYITMLVSILVVLAVPEYRNSFMPGMWTILACFGFVMHWFRPATWCPSPPSWTVEALIPGWLLYPFLRRMVEGLERFGGLVALTILMLLLYAVSFGPLLLLYSKQNGHLNWGQFATSFMWPPAQLSDFALGVVACHVYQRSQGESRAHPRGTWGSFCLAVVGDLALVAFGAMVIMLPSPKSRAECQTDANGLLSHGGSLAIATFLCLGSSKAGPLGRLLSHQALVALGKYSFEVYLFQWPLQAIFRQWQRWPENETFMAFLLVLWLLAGLYVEFLAEPMTSFLRSLEGSGNSSDLQKTNLRGETRS